MKGFDMYLPANAAGLGINIVQFDFSVLDNPSHQPQLDKLLPVKSQLEKLLLQQPQVGPRRGKQRQDRQLQEEPQLDQLQQGKQQQDKPRQDRQQQDNKQQDNKQQESNHEQATTVQTTTAQATIGQATTEQATAGQTTGLATTNRATTGQATAGVATTSQAGSAGTPSPATTESVLYLFQFFCCKHCARSYGRSIVPHIGVSFSHSRLVSQTTVFESARDSCPTSSSSRIIG